MSPSSVEMTCCCLRGFFLGEAPGGKSLGGMERLLASSAKDGDTVLVVKGGTAERKKEKNPTISSGKIRHCNTTSNSRSCFSTVRGVMYTNRPDIKPPVIIRTNL